MNKQVILVVSTVVALSMCAFAAETQTAETAYCRYIAEQASAQRDLLRTPSGVAGPTQPSAGTPPQMVFGITSSLADILKASLTMKAARTKCDVYTAATEAQLHIDYASANIEREVLLHRLELIQEATAKLQTIEADQEKLVEAQNMTRPAIYHLESARASLDTSRTAALTGVISPFVPEMSDVPIRVLVGDKLRSEQANQRAEAKLAKASGWDVAMAAGGRQQIGQFNSTADVSNFGGFGEATVTYNFGRHSANQHLDRSVSAYMDWKQNQLDDVARQAVILQRRLEETADMLRQQLKILLGHDSEMDKSLKSLAGLDTSNALAFRDQITADEIILHVEIGDLQYRLERVETYLHDNF